MYVLLQSSFSFKEETCWSLSLSQQELIWLNELSSQPVLFMSASNRFHPKGIFSQARHIHK